MVEAGQRGCYLVCKKSGHTSPPVPWRVRVVARRDGVRIANLVITAVDDHFATAGVADDLAGAVGCLRLGVMVGASATRTRLDDIPAAVGVRRYVPFVARENGFLLGPVGLRGRSATLSACVSKLTPV